MTKEPNKTEDQIETLDDAALDDAQGGYLTITMSNVTGDKKPISKPDYGWKIEEGES